MLKFICIFSCLSAHYTQFKSTIFGYFCPLYLFFTTTYLPVDISFSPKHNFYRLLLPKRIKFKPVPWGCPLVCLRQRRSSDRFLWSWRTWLARSLDSLTCSSCSTGILSVSWLRWPRIAFLASRWHWPAIACSPTRNYTVAFVTKRRVQIELDVFELKRTF